MVFNLNDDGERAGGNNATTAETSSNRVVVSGMSALMPGCNDLEEFNKKLYNKENFVVNQEPLWHSNHPEVTPYRGKIADLDRFDAQFFMVHYRLAQSSDSTSRKVLEQTYQAIIDADQNHHRMVLYMVLRSRIVKSRVVISGSGGGDNPPCVRQILGSGSLSRANPPSAGTKCGDRRLGGISEVHQLLPRAE
ncbi:unnamed protein product [Spodoptera exigua]|nr:unnamed protein product [Spodoptera exigua]